MIVRFLILERNAATEQDELALKELDKEIKVLEGQTGIERKLQSLLQQKEKLEKKRDHERKNREEVIDSFATAEGQCNGLSVLWAYGRKLSEVPVSNPRKERDDIQSFKGAIRLLKESDGGNQLTSEERKKVDRFHLLGDDKMMTSQLERILKPNRMTVINISTRYDPCRS